MKAQMSTLLLLFVIGCGGVKHLSLSDTRLLIEARRWFADAEDEVAITTARVVDARKNLKRIETYQDTVVSELKKKWPKGKSSQDGLKAWKAFDAYTEARVKLAEAILDAANESRNLAMMRLTQARAETAMRYDIAVYEIDPIIHEVEELRKSVANHTKIVEAQRIKVEKSAGAAWKAFYQFAQKGGITNALWYAQ
jgi:hypothetical protein